MTGRNQNVVSEFLLLGLPIESEHQNLFFVLFLAMYVTTILGNLLIIVLICLDPHLHTPISGIVPPLTLIDRFPCKASEIQMINELRLHLCFGRLHMRCKENEKADVVIEIAI